MNDVYIIGTGGFAAELTDYIDHNNTTTTIKINILGYFDINDNNYTQYSYQAPFLGDEKEYQFKKDAKVLIAVGDLETRLKIINFLLSENVAIVSFIHNTVIISKSSQIGLGNIICPYTIIGPNTKIGNYNLINYYCAIPHDCTLNHFNVFSPNVQITGYTTIGDRNLFGVSTGTKPSISIGNHNKIQPGVIVDKNIGDNALVFKIEKIKSMELYK